jgi:uncharacterized membrane protein
MLHHPPFFVDATPDLLVVYTVIPWVGVMMLGYCVGHWFKKTPEKQERTLLIAGVVALVSFFILRAINVYGDPLPWQTQERGALFTVLSFFNISKSPPSLLFLLWTIGVGLIALSLLTRVQKFSYLRVFGSVPFFYFILHFTLIVVGAFLWTFFQYGESINLAMSNADQWPAGYSPNLARAYLVWILLIFVLYFPCRWFSAYRKKHPEKRWLSYL